MDSSLSKKRLKVIADGWITDELTLTEQSTLPNLIRVAWNPNQNHNTHHIIWTSWHWSYVNIANTQKINICQKYVEAW